MKINKRIRKKKTLKVKKVKIIFNKPLLKATNIPIFKPVETRRFMYKPQYNLGGMYWRFHPNDVDSWPSRPHGDQIGGPHKLNVRTGEIINRNTKLVAKRLSKKEFHRLWQDKDFLRVVDKSEALFGI